MSAITSEDSILAIIDRHFPSEHPRLVLGRGDDCCVLATGEALAVSTDLFMEDVHFRRSYFTPEDIGWKALAVNVSDLAAAGAHPAGFSLGLALPRDASTELVDGLFAGMAELAGPLSLPLTGGDLSVADRLHLCVTVFGDITPATSLRRRNASPGDLIFLGGRIGLARVGLKVLEAQGRQAMAVYPEACAAHLRPEPRLRDGMRLGALQAQQDGRISLMDVSDGLARDLPRLLGPLGADLTLPAPHPECLSWAASQVTDSREAAELALKNCWLGGEDYAVVGTCEPRLAATVMTLIPDGAVLGRVTDDGVLRWNGHTASVEGFDHFAS
ncbi:MAG TPA: thiamine-phosphate kinase [Candidatus Avidesulfovibrio excrementigallinarum]|nr:thiamine-phosphate kinase [Candidatus Avidesulfovibrio excrementigallinarum]